MRSMKVIHLWVVLGLVMLSCADNAENDIQGPDPIQAEDFSLGVSENQSVGQVLGTLQVSGTGTLNYTMGSQVPAGSLTVNASGEIIVNDSCSFNFERNSSITATVNVADSLSSTNLSVAINLIDRPESLTLWTGDTLTFSKASGADPELSTNQDQISPNVWITRGNNGGQIYNRKLETSADPDTSPVGTLWALGSLSEVETLCFDTFRNTIRPKNVVGVNLVMYAVADDAYLEIKFSEWPAGKQGGFAYTRTAP